MTYLRFFFKHFPTLAVVFCVIAVTITTPLYTVYTAFLLSGIALSWLWLTIPRGKLWFKVASGVFLFAVFALFYAYAGNESLYVLFISGIVVIATMVYITLDLTAAELTIPIRQFILSAVFVAAAYLGLFALSYALTQSHKIKDMEKMQAAILQLTNQRKDEVAAISNSIASDPVFPGLIKQGNVDSILGYSQNLQIAHRLSYLTITDRVGTVLARSHRPAIIGDTLPIAMPETLPVFGGQTFAGIIKSNDAPVSLIAGSPIYESGQLVGTVFAGETFDNDFAGKLISGDSLSLAFCSQNSYIGGTLPQDQEDYLNRICRQADNLAATGIVSAGRLTYRYFLQPITAAGDRVIGHQIIMASDQVSLSAAKTAIAVFSIGLPLLWLAYLNRSKLKLSLLRPKRIKLVWPSSKALLLAAGTTILVGAFSALFAIPSTRIFFQSLIAPKVKPIQPAIAGPSLSTKLSQSKIQPGQKTNFSIYIDGQSEINSVEVKLDFSGNIIAISAIDMQSSDCTESVQKSIDNDTGTFMLSCDLKKRDGIPRRTLVILELTSKKAGVAAIAVRQHLAIDDNNRSWPLNLNQGTVGGDFLTVLTEENRIIRPMPIIAPNPSGKNGWHSNGSLNFEWLVPAETSVKYCISKTKGECVEYYVTNQQKERLSVPDGIWYFNLLSVDSKDADLNNAVQLKVDSTPPEELKPLIGKDEVDFTVKDGTSGVDEFTVTIDGREYKETETSFKLPTLSPGTHQAVATVVDLAGNVRRYEFTINR